MHPISIRSMIKRWTLFALLLASLQLSAQEVDNWKTLAMVTFDTTFDPDWGIDIQVPNVGPIVQSLEGKEIEVQGFIIPLTGKVEQSHYMLSRYPQSLCFFCGKAGPESAMQVFSKDQKMVAFTDEKIKVKGTLRINQSDMTNPLYTLEDAVVIK